MMTPDQFLRDYVSSPSLENTFSMIAEDAVYWFSNESHHVGKAAVEKAIRHNFETIKEETYRILDVQWIVETEDTAVGLYRFEWSGKINGKPASGAGRGTTVLRRNGDSWLIAHEHLSKGGHQLPGALS